MILVERRREIIMENIVKIVLIHMVVPLNVRMMIMNAAPQHQTAPPFANPMKFHVQLTGKMKMVVVYLIHALFRNEITMESFVLCIAQVYVTKGKSCAQVEEMMKVVKNQTSVNHCPRNYGET